MRAEVIQQEIISFVSSEVACKAGGLAAQGRCSLLPLETHLKTQRRKGKKEGKKEAELPREAWRQVVGCN